MSRGNLTYRGTKACLTASQGRGARRDMQRTEVYSALPPVQPETGKNIPRVPHGTPLRGASISTALARVIEVPVIQGYRYLGMSRMGGYRQVGRSADEEY